MRIEEQKIYVKRKIKETEWNDIFAFKMMIIHIFMKYEDVPESVCHIQGEMAEENAGEKHEVFP